MNELKFYDFLESIDEDSRLFASEINELLLKKGCKCELKAAKSGYTVSYLLSGSKKTIANFICRKTGVKLRIYPQFLEQYMDFLETLPDKMKSGIAKSSVCKRLINPEDCNPKCVKGYDFYLDGEHYQKCRYSAFTLPLNPLNNPYIKTFLEKDLNCQIII